MRSRYSRSGARRSGDDYQDIIALDALVEMLLHPGRYKWVRVEADDAGFLDDVVVLRNDDQIIAKQVKFSTNPNSDDDPWTFEKLLEKRSGKTKSSLLEKWSSSFNILRTKGTIDEISVISNRRGSDDLQAALCPNGILDFDKIKNPQVQSEIINQLGDEIIGREFLNQFHFYLDEQDLDEKEKSVRKKFSNLGGTNEGWLNLKDKLRYWIRNKNEPNPGGEITCADVRRESLWYQLESMPQRFGIPKDYVIPSKHFHQAILDKISQANKGCIVLNASPGVGKSTYLSYLFDYLESIKHPVIRHHYFLSFSDRTIERMNYQRIAESLMSDLSKKYFKALGDLEIDNPNPRDLKLWVERCGEFFSGKNESLVIIIDGLDHVWREKGSREELDRLFEHLLPAPEGIIVMVGTQPIDDTQLPSLLLRSAPRDKWLRLPLLDRSAIKKWLLFHENQFANFDKSKLEFQEYELDRFADLFHRKSQGHPLHLRYTLKALQDQNIPITEENVEKMPSILHEDINEYYNNLWRGLPEPGKTILYLFASCNFNWKKEWIIDCLEPNGYSQIQISEGFKQIAHLTDKGPLGIQPFHNSIFVFIESQEDYEIYSCRMKKYAIEWLQEKAPKYWKWAYEWRLLSEIGEHQSIINGPSRDWVVDALAKRYPFQNVSDILGEGCWYALKSEDLPRGVEIGLLRDYAQAAYDNSEALEKMLYSQLLLNEDPFLRQRLEKEISDLSGRELFLLAEMEHRNDRSVIVKCFDELNRRIINSGSKYSRYYHDPWSTAITPSLEVAVLIDDVNILSCIEFALAYRESNRSAYILDTIGHSIRVYRRIDLMHEILCTIDDLSTSEQSVIFEHMVLLALEENIDLDQRLIQKVCSYDPFLSIYAYFKDMDYFRLSNIQFPPCDFLDIESHRQFEQLAYIEESIYRAFFCLLANYLWDSYINNDIWIKTLSQKDTWPSKLICRLDIIAKELSDLFSSNTPPSFGWFYRKIGDIRKLSFRDDRNFYQYAIAAGRAFDKIAFNIFILSMFQSESLQISKSDLKLALGSNLFDEWKWIDNYVSERRQWIERDAAQWLICRQERKLDNSVMNFPERASNYATIASFAALHDFKEEAKESIYNAAENLISYGWHKDIILYYLLTSIEKCHRAGIGNVRQWAIELSPLVANIRDFTDGDETSDSPRILADLIAKVDPDLLIDYYQWLCENEEYYDAQSAFHSFLRVADLSNNINQAIAKTAIDDESILILDERANSGDISARTTLLTIIDLFGNETKNFIKTTTSSNESLNSNGFIEPKLPSPQDFPPDKLADYLSIAGSGSSYFKNDSIIPWINFWRTTDRKREAFKAIDEKDIDFKDYYIMFEIALNILGKDNSYPWLIKANSGYHDVWSYNWIGEEQAIKQMEMVKKYYYPSKWLDFILETIKSPSGEPWSRLNIYHRFPRLISYCILLGKTAIAVEMAQKVINFVIDLVSPQKLPAPGWVNNNE